eukprot:8003288-Pyramimonas_sp.AAC.1
MSYITGYIMLLFLRSWVVMQTVDVDLTADWSVMGRRVEMWMGSSELRAVPEGVLGIADDRMGKQRHVLPQLVSPSCMGIHHGKHI